MTKASLLRKLRGAEAGGFLRAELGARFVVHGLGFRVQGLGFRVGYEFLKNPTQKN